jgi:hypothetical protein
LAELSELKSSSCWNAQYTVLASQFFAMEGKYLFVKRGSSYMYLIPVHLTDDLVMFMPTKALDTRRMKNSFLYDLRVQ